MLPNFLIVGAPKSGTTSLFGYLSQHPDVYVPYLKEPGFFSWPEKSCRFSSINEYQRELFSGVRSERAVGESTTWYLANPLCPERILNHLGPSTKIILILRNPIDLVYSFWAHRTRAGGETRPFLEALESGREYCETITLEQMLGLLGDVWKSEPYPYIYQATYSEQVARYTCRFDNLRIFIFEEFFNNIQGNFREVCQFLDVDDQFSPKFKVYNRAGVPRSRLLSSVLDYPHAVKEPFKTVLPIRVRHFIKFYFRNINTKRKTLQPLSSKTRSELVSYFKGDVRKLERLLDRSLDTVWQDFGNC